MQNPNAIKPEIGKLPKSTVEKIPLVNYIPPPPSIGLVKETSFPQMYYPPQPKKQQMRFRLLPNFSLLGSKSSKNENIQTENEGENNSDSWADSWEQGQYPFITLDGNRATCAICLSDFEAPPKRRASGEMPTNQDEEMISGKSDSTEEANTESQPQGEALKSQDAGPGPQPLRLLGCAHVFHVRIVCLVYRKVVYAYCSLFLQKLCIDPWLTDVSGRCPVCQRAVEPKKPHKSQRL